MALFVFTLDKQLDRNWAALEAGAHAPLWASDPNADAANGALRAARTLSELGKHHQELVSLVSKRPSDPIACRMPWDGPKPLAEFEIEPEVRSFHRWQDVAFDYCASRLLQDLAAWNPTDRPGSKFVALAAGVPAYHVSCWINVGHTVLVYLAVRLTFTDNRISAGWGHVILWQQPWMRRPKSMTPSWRLGLATDTARHFGPHGLYRHEWRDIQSGRLFYDTKGRLYPEGTNDRRVWISERLHSPYTFLVQDTPFPFVSPVGVLVTSFEERARKALKTIRLKVLNDSTEDGTLWQ